VYNKENLTDQMADNQTPWISYILLTIFVAITTAILTENSVLKRIRYAEGVTFYNGKCRLKEGYGPVRVDKNNKEEEEEE
jgi:hypothetical protein